MGKGLFHGRAALTALPALADLFASVGAETAAAVSQVVQQGWPVHPDTHETAALARWEMTRAEREAAHARLVDAPLRGAELYMTAVEQGWTQCVTGAPSAYRATIMLGDLPRPEVVRWHELARRTATFDRQCVLGGSPATFGIEIEFVGDLERIARALYEVGLTTSPEVSDHNRPEGWTVKPDPTVPSGGEVVSPILVDLPAAWDGLGRVCNVLRDQGATVDRSCGLHIHVGADRLDGDVPSYLRLFLLNRAFEDLLYRLSSASADHLQRRHRGLSYDQPIGTRGYRPFVRSVGEFQRQISAEIFDAVNFTNVGSEKNTIEFRYPNGTLDEQQIQALTVVFVGLIEAARRGQVALQDLPAETLGTHASAGRTNDDDRAVLRLCDTVFPSNNRAKLHVLWLYARSRWQRPEELAPRGDLDLLAPIFKRVIGAAA